MLNAANGPQLQLTKIEDTASFIYLYIKRKVKPKNECIIKINSFRKWE